MDFKKMLNERERKDMMLYIVKNSLHTKEELEQWDDLNLQIIRNNVAKGL